MINVLFFFTPFWSSFLLSMYLFVCSCNTFQMNICWMSLNFRPFFFFGFTFSISWIDIFVHWFRVVVGLFSWNFLFFYFLFSLIFFFILSTCILLTVLSFFAFVQIVFHLVFLFALRNFHYSTESIQSWKMCTDVIYCGFGKNHKRQRKSREKKSLFGLLRSWFEEIKSAFPSSFSPFTSFSVFLLF